MLKHAMSLLCSVVVGLAMSACVAQGQPREDKRPAGEPLTEEQVEKLRDIVHATQRATQRLQARLDECQGELSRVYAEYRLDEERANQLRAEIVDLQTKLLDNHHKMQTELRAIVGEARFQTLSKRIKNMLDTRKQDRK